MKFRIPLGITSLLLLVAAATPLPATATSTRVYVNPALIDSPLVSQIFTATISIADVTNLAYWQARLAFSPTILNCTGATIPLNNIFQGFIQAPVVWEINNIDGFIRIENKLDQAGGASGSGILFQVEFKALTEGTTPLSFQYKGSPIGTVLIDSSAKTIPFDTTNGQVEVNIAQKEIANVPFYFQEKTYYSGPASLEMVFDLYGENVSQLEIAEVARTHPNTTFTDELRRAGHFSSVSTSQGSEMSGSIIGYSLRQLGYGVFERSSMSLAQLQDSIRDDSPVIVSTWYDATKQSSHYRVVLGYNLTHIKIHDPWNKAAWGGAYGGAYSSIDYGTFLTLWNQSNYWGLLVHPWEVKPTFKIIEKQPYTINFIVNVKYVSTEIFTNPAYEATSANAKITLPPELYLDAGETATKTLGTGSLQPTGSASVSWIVKSSTTDPGKFNVTVEAKGEISGTVGAHDSYPPYDYQDHIGGRNGGTIWVGFAGDLNGDGKVDIKDIAIVAKAFGSYLGSPNWNPVADVTGSTLGVPDNKVDIRDVAFVAKKFGTIYP